MGIQYAQPTSFSWYNRMVRDTEEPYGGIHQSHDKGYKFLLSNTENFIELLSSFVHEDWVKQLHVDQVERLDKSFILSDFKGQEADQLYRMKMNGHEVIFYVLLELQSSVDFQMPYRLLELVQ